MDERFEQVARRNEVRFLDLVQEFAEKLGKKGITKLFNPLHELMGDLYVNGYHQAVMDMLKLNGSPAIKGEQMTEYIDNNNFDK